jgi:hypothetical protein
MPPSQKSSSTHYDSRDNGRDYGSGSGNPGKLNAFDLLVKLPILLLMLGFFGFFIISKGTCDPEEAKAFLARLPDMPAEFVQQLNDQKERQSAYEATAVQDRYYVGSLGRYCEWDDKYECYYDAETDCYFWYNDTTKTHTWQYWYEGISSDYGDYGWMEWDSSEMQWYIEVSDGDWEPLPEEYDRARLWHVE